MLLFFARLDILRLRDDPICTPGREPGPMGASSSSKEEAERGRIADDSIAVVLPFASSVAATKARQIPIRHLCGL